LALAEASEHFAHLLGVPVLGLPALYNFAGMAFLFI